MSQLTRDDFDSWDEYHFYLWILDGKELGLIKEAKFYPKAFELSDIITYNKEMVLKTKTKIVKKKLLAPHVYTADAIVRFDILFKTLFPSTAFVEHEGIAWFDVKPSVNPKYIKYGSSKTFPLNQKWVYQRHGIYINRVMMKVLFHQTWCPHTVRTGKKIPVYKQWLGSKTKEDIKNMIFENRTIFN